MFSKFEKEQQLTESKIYVPLYEIVLLYYPKIYLCMKLLHYPVRPCLKKKGHSLSAGSGAVICVIQSLMVMMMMMMKKMMLAMVMILRMMMRMMMAMILTMMVMMVVSAGSDAVCSKKRGEGRPLLWVDINFGVWSSDLMFVVCSGMALCAF